MRQPCGEVKNVAAGFSAFDVASVQSLSENSGGSCGEGFWSWARRRGWRWCPSGRSAAGCDDRANAAHGQNPSPPKGFSAPDHQASRFCRRRFARNPDF